MKLELSANRRRGCNFIMIDIIIGNALSELRKLESESVDCCVTSPPYFGLRDYGTGIWEGGDPDCNHIENRGGRNPETSHKQITNTGSVQIQYRKLCARCGATRTDQQVGSETTLCEYVEKMVEIFRDVRRVLKPSGTCWLNLGDSYAGSRATPENRRNIINQPMSDGEISPMRTSRLGDSLKGKDLMMVPARVAIALQDDGWFLRSDIIWSKPNCMPESCRDRPTSAHEHVFLLTKSAKYYYDADAIARPLSEATIQDIKRRKNPGNCEGDSVFGKASGLGCGPRVKGFDGAYPTDRLTANARNVWEIPTVPYPNGHFATFPPEIPRRCIRAGCPAGGLVLDPFAGSGTALAVALSEGRRAIGIELNPDFLPLIEERISQSNLPLDFEAIPVKESE